MVRRLRAQGLIRLDRRRLTLLQPERLAELSGFDPSYLYPCAEPPEAARRARHG
jgi:hypothetical protein